MDLLSPLLPAIVLGVVGYIVKDRLPWWSVPLIVFFAILALQFGVISSKLSLSEKFPPSIQVKVYLSPLNYTLPMLLTSAYFAALSLLFTLVGLGSYRFLERWVRNDPARIVISAYIALVLLQLWVEVFPWTLAVPLRFYSPSP